MIDLVADYKRNVVCSPQGDLRFDDFEISVFVKHVWTSLHVGLASARQQRRYVLERHHYGMEFIDAASASD